MGKYKLTQLIKEQNQAQSFSGRYQHGESVVYAIVSPFTPKFYIGETNNFSIRIEQHFRQALKLLNEKGRKVTSDLRHIN